MSAGLNAQPVLHQFPNHDPGPTLPGVCPGFILSIEEANDSELNLQFVLIDMAVKDYAPCLIFQVGDPEQTSRSTSTSV